MKLKSKAELAYDFDLSHICSRFLSKTASSFIFWPAAFISWFQLNGSFFRERIPISTQKWSEQCENAFDINFFHCFWFFNPNFRSQFSSFTIWSAVLLIGTFLFGTSVHLSKMTLQIMLVMQRVSILSVSEKLFLWN